MREFKNLIWRAANHKGDVESFIKISNLKRLRVNWGSARVWGNELLVIKTEGVKLADIPPKDAIPTVVVIINKEKCYIQPRATKRNSLGAYKLLRDNDDWLDPCEDNCGWYKGKAVIIDW